MPQGELKFKTYGIYFKNQKILYEGVFQNYFIRFILQDLVAGGFLQYPTHCSGLNIAHFGYQIVLFFMAKLCM